MNQNEVPSTLNTEGIIQNAKWRRRFTSGAAVCSQRARSCRAAGNGRCVPTAEMGRRTVNAGCYTNNVHLKSHRKNFKHVSSVMTRENIALFRSPGYNY